MAKARFDEIIHAPLRLQICGLLVPLREAEFKLLRDTLEISDSVLSKHVKVLSEAGYLELRKGSAAGRPRTWVYLTASGRSAFAGHLAELQRLAALDADAVAAK